IPRNVNCGTANRWKRSLTLWANARGTLNYIKQEFMLAKAAIISMHMMVRRLVQGSDAQSRTADGACERGGVGPSGRKIMLWIIRLPSRQVQNRRFQFPRVLGQAWGKHHGRL